MPCYNIDGYNEGQYDDCHEIPICWNYTARYRNSGKIFKASGCGPFPNALVVPSNVDPATGRMVDDGMPIGPDSYKIVIGD